MNESDLQRLSRAFKDDPFVETARPLAELCRRQAINDKALDLLCLLLYREGIHSRPTTLQNRQGFALTGLGLSVILERRDVYPMIESATWPAYLTGVRYEFDWGLFGYAIRVKEENRPGWWRRDYQRESDEKMGASDR